MNLFDFLVESNRIEGIDDEEVAGLQVPLVKSFIEGDPLLPDYLALLPHIQPDAELREFTSVPNVMIGGHVATPSGPDIKLRLMDIFGNTVCSEEDPFVLHRRFEDLHPFTDGNGRMGRILWLYQMVNNYNYEYTRLFLHEWYYQSLAAFR